MAEPWLISNAETLTRLAEILAARGIKPPTDQEIDGYSPDEPGHPHFHRQQRITVALSRWTTATPPRYQHAAATDPTVIAWAADVIANPDNASSLLITGTTGTGKTYEAFGALKLIAAHGLKDYRLIATTTADLYGNLRPTGSAGASEQGLKRLCEIPLLLLDDLGSAKTSEWTEEITYRLINHRYNQCLPTIFTSNLPPRAATGPDLTSTLGERIASRLAEMVTVVPMAGADRRRAA
ncbi:ATP-binding protein [Kitasatospora sp. A2-31]|uniref:ATP-binding protein n=1 Tax=Kitasatospora sp. A2-31 TaxID=2916414 RepID=UPI001EE8B4E9|nr:ATP-binding protein [Kitasatospora sp. A2-31]MCG6493396.1 ATP-binding protein [Kitasatospora sp. A2-31]